MMFNFNWLYLLLLLIAIVVLFLFCETPIKLNFPKTLVENDIEKTKRMQNIFSYPHGNIFVFSKRFKTQKLLINLFLQKYTEQIKRLKTKYHINIYDYINNIDDLQQLFFKNKLKDKRCFILLYELKILNNIYILKKEPHIYSSKKMYDKFKIMEVIVCYACLNKFISSLQLAYVEQVAIDFSISSLTLKKLFQNYLSSNKKILQQKIKLLVQNIDIDKKILFADLFNVFYLGYNYNNNFDKKFLDTVFCSADITYGELWRIKKNIIDNFKQESKND